MLAALRKEQWEYYLDECLPSDKTILDKLTNEKPAQRWIELASEFTLVEFKIADRKVKDLVSATSSSAVRKNCNQLRNIQ